MSGYFGFAATNRIPPPFPIPQAQRLHGKVAVHAGDDHIAIGGAEGAVHDEEVAVADARANHGIALNTHEVRGGGPLHQQLVEVEWRLEILLGGRWKPRHDGTGNFSFRGHERTR